MTTLGQLVYDPLVQDLMTTIGIPYHWGAGKPSTPWPPKPDDGLDCSGCAQVMLVRLGYLKPTEPDRNAFGLANACDPIVAGVSLGDLVFYGIPGAITHVMVCLGNGWCIGATGGGSMTKGDDPTAYVMLKRTLYRKDFRCIGRIKPQFQP